MVRFARRMDQIEVSGIRRMFDLASKIKDPIDFSLGQPDFGPPRRLLEAARRAMDRGGNRYAPTQGIAALQQRIMEWFHERYPIRLKGYYKSLITVGATGSLFLASMVLLEEGDEVLIPDPYFGLYRHIVHVCGATPVLIDTYPTRFRLTPRQIERHVTRRTKLLIFNNPVNPTGVAYRPDEVRAIGAVARRLGVMLLSDEVYDAFCYDFRFESALSLCENAILVGAFSKSYGIPGWRLGYAIGPAEIVEKMTTLQQFTYVCAPSVAQHAMVDALRLDPARWIAESYRRKRDLAYSILKKDFDVMRPEGAFYLWPRAPGNAEAFVRRALEHKVVVVPGRTFSSRDTHFRVSFASSDRLLKKGLGILARLA